MIDWIELGVVSILLIATLLVFAIAICIFVVTLLLLVSLLHRNDGIAPDPAKHLSRGDLGDSWEAPAEDQKEPWYLKTLDDEPLGEEDALDTAEAITAHLRDLEQERRR